MVEGRERMQWWHTATLAAHILNTAIDPRKTKPFKPQQLHPYARRPSADEIDGDITALRSLL